MFSKLIKGIKALDFEEKILHTGAILALIGVLMPWYEGKRFCIETLCSGFAFLTGYIGIAVFLLQAALLVITISPIVGGPILVRKSHRNFVRTMIEAASVLLLFSALSVLIKVFTEDSGATIRFGIYLSLIGSIVALLYAFLRDQEQRRSQVQELFQHPEDIGPSKSIAKELEEISPPPPPPPPPMPDAEDHNIFYRP